MSKVMYALALPTRCLMRSATPVTPSVSTSVPWTICRPQSSGACVLMPIWIERSGRMTPALTARATNEP
jgi:hypothetical protein